MRSHRWTALAALALALAGCSTTTNGTGRAAVSPAGTASSTPDFPSPAGSAGAASTPPVENTTAASPTDTIIPAPPQPVRTAAVSTPDGTTYDVQIWADVSNASCFDHAYGTIVNFLINHPCDGLERVLATTTVNGRPVGFNESSTGFPGTPNNLYGEAGRFAKLEREDGTGSISDLLREGYRLPEGPTAVPDSEAFNVLGQDQGVTVWDVWYLDRPTPNNDPALIKMTEDLFLQF